MDRAAIVACPIMVVGVVMHAAVPNQASEETPADIESGQKQTLAPPSSRASLLVGHVYARIVGPHGSLQLGGINLLALCPLDKVGRAIRWISAPPLEHAGVDRLVDVDVASVFPNIRLSADGAIKRRRNHGVESIAKRLIGVRQSVLSEHLHPDRPPIGTKVRAIPPSSSSSAAEPEQEDRSR